MKGKKKDDRKHMTSKNVSVVENVNYSQLDIPKASTQKQEAKSTMFS